VPRGHTCALAQLVPPLERSLAVTAGWQQLLACTAATEWPSSSCSV
jgi:hypothetical protein